MKEKLLNVLDDAAHRIIITTGGVSMGEKVHSYIQIKESFTSILLNKRLLRFKRISM